MARKKEKIPPVPIFDDAIDEALAEKKSGLAEGYRKLQNFSQKYALLVTEIGYLPDEKKVYMRTDSLYEISVLVAN